MLLALAATLQQMHCHEGSAAVAGALNPPDTHTHPQLSRLCLGLPGRAGRGTDVTDEVLKHTTRQVDEGRRR